jgi:hypothetical protein
MVHVIHRGQRASRERIGEQLLVLIRVCWEFFYIFGEPRVPRQSNRIDILNIEDRLIQNPLDTSSRPGANPMSLPSKSFLFHVGYNSAIFNKARSSIVLISAA